MDTTIEDIKLGSYNKLINNINNPKMNYGVISSLMINDDQLNFLRKKYLVVNIGKQGGSYGTMYLVCKG